MFASIFGARQHADLAIARATDHDDGVECKHGQEECLGNIIELCAAKLYLDPKIYLGFTWCTYSDPSCTLQCAILTFALLGLTRDYEDIPKRELVEDCALEHGMSMDKLNDCTVGDDGALSIDMLVASFNRSSRAGVNRSCTIRLNNEIRCIRDGGEWKECDGGSTAEDLVNDIVDLVAAAETEEIAA
jgi:hypothetical protein